MKAKFQMTICILLVALLFCACNGSYDPEARPVAQEMMTALETNDVAAAMERMHPDALEQIDNAQESMKTLCEFVDGRSTTELTQETLYIRNQVGTNAGKYETGSFRAVLDDGTVLKIEYTYLKNAAGSGFLSFYLSNGT